MFRGQFVHSIDVKGRVSLPVRFRDALLYDGEARFILTPAVFDPCLHIYPMRAWEDYEQKISELSSLDTNVVRFRRLYVSAAIECELDKAGRVLVPPHLRDKARLEKDVLWAGMGRLIEVWSKPLWDRATSMTPDEHEAFRHAAEQLKI